MRCSPRCAPQFTLGRFSTTWTVSRRRSPSWVANTSRGFPSGACHLELMTMTSTDFASIRLPWDAADPYPFYEARRARGEVVWDDTAQAWLAVSYEAAREVLGGSGWTSDPLANPLARAEIDPLSANFFAGSMLFADGDRHTRLRTTVRDVFTRSLVTSLRAGVETISTTLIDEPTVGVPFDF